MQRVIVNIDGVLHSGETLEAAKVSVFDRSYLYGDSLYEVARTYRGKMLGMPEHRQRLRQSALLCRLVLSEDLLDTFDQEMIRSLEAFQAQFGGADKAPEAYVRIIVSRGVGRIGFSRKTIAQGPLFTIIVQELEGPSPSQIHKGLCMQVVERVRNAPYALDPAMKSGNYLNSLLAFLEATDPLPPSKASGYDDALLCDAEGFVTEGTTFNVFYTKGDVVVTPPLRVGILDGITRRHVIRLAGELDLEVRQVAFPKERLYEADEVFLTSTIREVLAITQVDNVRLSNGMMGPITHQLRDAFGRWALEATTQ